jgi:hypothetical protein
MTYERLLNHLVDVRHIDTSPRTSTEKTPELANSQRAETLRSYVGRIVAG